MRYRSDVFDSGDFDTGRCKGPDGGLAPRARSAHEDVDLAYPVLHRPASGLLGCQLGCEGGGLAGALEADVAGRRPREDIALLVGDGDDRVVEGALDVGDAVGDVLRSRFRGRRAEAVVFFEAGISAS